MPVGRLLPVAPDFTWAAFKKDDAAAQKTQATSAIAHPIFSDAPSRFWLTCFVISFDFTNDDASDGLLH
jgi:hypothetical protein